MLLTPTSEARLALQVFPGLKRDLLLIGLLFVPEVLHDVYHAVDGLSGWKADKLLPWLAPLFASHEGIGFYLHVVVVLAGVIAFTYLFIRFAHAVQIAVRMTAYIREGSVSQA